MFVGTYVFLASKIDRQRAEQLAEMRRGFEAHHATFLADQAFAGGLELFAPRDGDRDAGPSLNPRVEWSGDSSLVEKWRADRAGASATLVLSEAQRTRLQEQEWQALGLDAIEDFDFEWMGGLADFDYWDLERNSPLEMSDALDLYEAPLPQFLDLMLWAKARMLRGMHEGELAVAGRELRELARLLLTTEMLLGQMVGLAVLGTEDDMRTHLVNEEAAAPDGWTTYDESTRQRLTRTLWAVVAYTNFDTPDEYAAAVPGLQAGLCSALQEMGWGMILSRPLLADVRPADFARVGRLIHESDCRLVRLRAAWDDPGPSPDADTACEAVTHADSSAAEICQYATMTGWIPGARRLVGETLLSVASPNWWRKYDEAAEAQ